MPHLIPLGICNSSPIIALDRVGRLGVLLEQFDKLLIPGAVAVEVGALSRQFEVVACEDQVRLAAFPPRIHAGEAQVLLLGLSTADSLLILDDWYARRFAALRGLALIGTIGLVLRAKRIGLVPAAGPVIGALIDAGFRVAPRVLDEAWRLTGESGLPDSSPGSVT